MADEKNASADPEGRGRDAESPTELPKRGWLDILSRTKQQLNEDNLTIVAAGVAFYSFVAVVPALAATISIYGLIADPAQVTENLQTLSRVLPHEVMPLLQEQMTRIVGDNQKAGWGAVVGVALAIYSSASATKALIQGLNIAYDEEERRGFFKLLFLSLGLTFAAIVGVLLVIALGGLLPAALNWFGVSSGVETLLNWLRWPVLVLLFVGALGGIYRFGPCRESPEWRWLSWGAGAATLLWIIGSAAFSLYVSKFGSYDKTYGSLGAVVVFLFWLYLTAFVVLLGAELNSEMERQTKRDTTTDPKKPLGKRGAYAADTVGEART